MENNFNAVLFALKQVVPFTYTQDYYVVFSKDKYTSLFNYSQGCCALFSKDK